MLVKLDELQDKNYVAFAYVAAATEMIEIRDSLSDHQIDFDKMEELSKSWSNKDKTLLNVASNIFTSGSKEADITGTFNSLNETDSGVVLVAISYLFNIKANVRISK